MNSEQAKKLSLPKIMSHLGYEPTQIQKNGTEYWYQSPFRNEKEPSFHTSFLGGKWIWKDFADSGGTVIDFVMRHEGFIKVSDALRFLDAVYNRRSVKLNRKPFNSQFSFQQQFDSPPKQLEFIEAKDVEKESILEYLQGKRKISASVTRKYLKEVHYRNLVNGKEFYAFGIENNSGGYEIRAATDEYPFKSALIARDITVIPGFKTGNGILNIFEGMTDFLSLLTLMKTDSLAGDSILMHSLSSYSKTLNYIKNRHYLHIHTYLDNNQSGANCNQKFLDEFQNQVSNESSLFLPFEDINEMLKAL